MILVLEQCLNAIQLGLMLFLLTAGLTLVFGIMDLINLSHGSFYMVGAYLAALLVQATGSFVLAVSGAILGAAIIGVLLERSVLSNLYRRNHLSQVLATYAILLICNEIVRILFGPLPMRLNAPPQLSGPIEIFGGLLYPSYRLLVIAVGALVAIGLYVLIAHTRVGMWVRAGASNRDMALMMGVNIDRLFTAVFALGTALCALAGALLGPLLSVQVGMGENILIVCFVVVVIGGIGSVRGALVGAMLVGFVDTIGRSVLPIVLKQYFNPAVASNLGPTLASILIYVLMAAILFFRPRGLFPARG
jgi:branched-chain amino acid transport system permease protein